LLLLTCHVYWLGLPLALAVKVTAEPLHICVVLDVSVTVCAEATKVNENKMQRAKRNLLMMVFFIFSKIITRKLLCQ
jgi:hypothetical protein